MKILVAYYSRTKGTEKLADVLIKKIRDSGHSVDVEKIKPQKEHSWFFWFFIRIFKGSCKIQPLKIKTVEDYDLILVGSPNWTRVSLPVGGYIKEVKGIRYRNVALFSTTFAPPALEWYILSAYLLDLSFAKMVEKKHGRVVDYLILSSFFKKWSFESDYGENMISDFCKKITSPITSFKKYFLRQKEVDNLRFLAVLTSFFFFSSIFAVAFLKVINIDISWEDYLWMGIVLFLTFILLTLVRDNKRFFFLAKYIPSVSFVFLWTMLVSHFALDLGTGRLMILGYIFIFVLFSSFRDEKVVAFSGAFTLLSYVFLFYFSPEKQVFNLFLDMSLIFASCVLFIIFTNTFREYYLTLLNSQDEVEKSRKGLEEKVKIKTKELKELNENLEKEVEKRTEKIKEQSADLEKKVNHLEKFNKLTIGRENRMKELKEEIETLKKEKQELEEKLNEK
jgi:hypothetical protein